MSGMLSWVRRHRLVAFFVLAFAIAWVGWPLHLLGLLPEPLFLPLGPLVAALVVISLTEGVPGLRGLGARMIRWRVGWQWYVVALGLPVIMVIATGMLNSALGAQTPAWGQLAWTQIALAFALWLVNPLEGAMGEEPGWRGYALPCLQAHHSPLISGLVLGVLAAAWHLPLVFFGKLGAIGIVSTFAITLVYVWLFNHTDGSVLLTLIFHAAQDSFTFGRLGFTGADATRVEWLYCLVVLVVAAAVVAFDRNAWRRPPNAAVQPPVATAQTVG